MNPKRCVVDTNLLISHLLLPQSLPANVVRHLFREQVVLISAELMIEIERVLARPKFDRYLNAQNRLMFLHHLRRVCIPVSIVQTISVCRDPKDNIVLELAINGRADLIVTGDQDLLVLHPFRGIDIMTAADYRIRYRCEEDGSGSSP